MSEIYDEASYVKYAESVIFDLQRCFRSKPGFENVPVIEMSAMLEEVCFHQALLDNAPVPSGDCLWLKRECIFQYQHRCEKMLRNLDAKERNWKKILEENEKNAKVVLSAIMKDDEGGRRKIENPYRAPKPPKPAAIRIAPADRLKNLTSGSSKLLGGPKGKVGNKKQAIGLRKVVNLESSSSGLLNASIDWNQLGGGYGGSLGTGAAAQTNVPNVAHSAATALADSLMTVGEDDFNLDMFDDDGSNVIQLSNPEAWQAPLQGEGVPATEQSTGASGQVWRLAIAERESTANREKALRNQRESQQDGLRRAREEGMLTAAAKREEEESTSKSAAEIAKREKLEAQQLKDQAREKERRAREEAEMTVDLDNDRGLLDEMDF